MILRIIFFMVIFVQSGIGQATYTIRVINSLSKTPIHKARIYFDGSSFKETNSLGYFEITANPNDTVLVSHPEFEDVYILLPNKYKFQVSLKLKHEFLHYSGGIDQFYAELQKQIRYPSDASMNRIQANLFVEIRIDSLGNSVPNLSSITSQYGFKSEIRKVFKNLSGHWSKAYEGRVFVLPILFRVSSLSPLKINEERIPVSDMRLNEIIITAYK